MSIQIKQMPLSPNKYSIKAPYKMQPQFITIHNTFNDAPALNEARYHNSNSNQVSFHYAVDDKEIIQVIPDNRNAWACGDGQGNGNRKSISIEICYSKSGGAKYISAEENAVQLTAHLLNKYKLPVSAVKQHYHWSGKNCPHRIRANDSWDSFLHRVQKALSKLQGTGGTNTPPAKNEPFRIKSGTFNTKLEAENAKAKVAKLGLANVNYITVHESNGKYYFQTGTYTNEASAKQALQKMKDNKILWVGSVIKA